MIRRSSTRIDLVITELTMSEMNGLEVAGQIRAIRSDLPVILTTGFMADLNHSQVAGVFKKLEKPVLKVTLADKIQRALVRS